jgi:hypothetical protein
VGRFLLVTASVFVTLIGCAWLWAFVGRMWFLDAEYAMWSANQEMTRACTPYDVVILGDSRAKAGLVPKVVGSRVANFALGGGTSIEAYYLLERMLRCPTTPKHAIVSFPAMFFGSVGVYWERSALFGFLSFAELEEVRRLSWQLNDPVIYSTRSANRLFHPLKNLSYAISTPTYYFPAMINAGFFMRKRRNDEVMQATIRSRGQHFFGTAESADWVIDHTKEFRVSPVLDHYFSELVRRLLEKDVRVWFVGMPLNKKTYDTFGPSAREDFLAYLQRFSATDARFRVVGEVVPWMTPDNFGDGQHLNAKGAAAWSKRVRSELALYGVDVGTASERE